jgi:hypothetical protein
MSRMRRLLLVALLLAGCASPPGEDPDAPRVVERPAPPEPPRARRFELVETAVLASSSDVAREVEISIPIASTDPGVQTIASMLVRITPDRAYDITKDIDGNRTIHVRCRGSEPVSVELSYVVEIAPVAIDLGLKKPRPLTETEKKLFARELAPGSADGALPSRPISALELQGEEPEARLLHCHEDYFPDVGWFVPLIPGAYRDHLIVLSRGTVAGEPVCASPLAVTYSWREATDR